MLLHREHPILAEILSPPATLHLYQASLPQLPNWATYRFAALTTPMPVSTACASNWTSDCASIINYREHIQPLWSKVRADNNADGDADTCTDCHQKVGGGGGPDGAAVSPVALEHLVVW